MTKKGSKGNLFSSYLSSLRSFFYIFVATKDLKRNNITMKTKILMTLLLLLAAVGIKAATTAQAVGVDWDEWD